MKVKFHIDTVIFGEPSFVAGEIYEVEDSLAEQLIARGNCEKYESLSVTKRLASLSKEEEVKEAKKEKKS